MENAHKTALRVTVVTLIALLVVAAIGYSLAPRVEAPVKDPADTTGNRATTTPEVKEEAKPVYTPPAYTPPPVTKTHIEINQIKNENTGTTNNTVQDRNEPVTEPPQTAPVFTEPRKLTVTERGEDILNIYNLTGTVEHLEEKNQIKVTLSTGQQVVHDLVDGWEEKLKLIINRIK